MMTLIEEATKKAVKKGDRFMDFRKEEIYEVTGWREPQHPGSTGRVYCKKYHKRIDAGDQVEVMENEFYPGVLGLKFVDAIDAENAAAKEYWSNEILYQIEGILSSPYDDEIKKKLEVISEEDRKDLAESLFDNIINDEWLWEKINGRIIEDIVDELELENSKEAK